MAQYRYDTLAQKDVTWGGLRVSVSLVQEMQDYFGNGEYTPTRDGLRIRTVTYIGGVEDSSLSWVKELPKPQIVQGLKIVASIGKIGLTAERVAEIAAAKAEVKKHPAWQAKVAAEDAADKAAAEYEQHRKAVDDMMTLGGKTY